MSPGNLEEPISFLSLFIRPCSLWNLDKIWVASKGLSCDFLSFHSFITLNFFEGKWIWVSVRLCQSTESWKPCLERLVFAWNSRLTSVMSFEPSLKWIQNEIKKHVNYTSLWLELHINLAPKWTRPSLTGKGKFTHFNHVQLHIFILDCLHPQVQWTTTSDHNSGHVIPTFSPLTPVIANDEKLPG